MERPVSQLRQRETSFNPEAAAFSPGCNFSAAVKAGPGSITTVEISQAALPMAPMFSYSPFNGPGGRHTFCRSDPLAPAPVRLEDFFSPDVQALVKTLEEHPEIQEIRAPQPPEPEPAKVTEDATEMIPFPSFTVQQEQPQTHGNPVGISELSLGLGLPAAKTDSNDAVSPTPSCTSRVPQAYPGVLFGKLIGRALDKPLTAKGLAEMLQNPDVSEPLEVLAPASTFRAMPAEPRTEPTSKVEISAHHRIPVPVSAETASPSKGPSVFQHQHRRSSASSMSHRKHARVSSNNRRRTSRAKRMDQGPMPSAADIYPDDAHWTLPAPIYETQDYLSYYQKSMENSQVIVGNLFDWPLPAQAYKSEPAPTAADIAASDIDVFALMTELPEPSLDTLAKLGNSQDLRASIAFTLPCDTRPLTPAQKDGSRYGMRLYGLAYGDEWEPPKFGTFEQAQPFRVRPRDHDGWGGREWAMSKAWNP